VTHQPKIRIRTLQPSDDFEALTDLLHRAYAELAEMGFRYTATYQSVDVTRDRCMSGTGLVAQRGGRVVGTVTYYGPRRAGGAEWYDRPDVASFGQFAVEPDLRGLGIGSLLMDAVEAMAVKDRAAEIACDTAEGASHLIALYERRGYRLVGTVDWRDTNYLSVILSKSLQDKGTTTEYLAE
jgi:GNAT superfamily N-acetyltransferase